MTSPLEAPTAEVGYAAGSSAPSPYGVALNAGPGWLYEGLEDTPELRFPGSASVYDRMRRSDGQIASVMRAMFGPIKGQPRRLVGEDVRPEVLAFCESEVGLAPLAGRQRRRRQGIVYAEHLRDALLSAVFGLMPFEQVYEVGPPAPGLEAATDGRPLVAHLRKLAPRMPRTLTEVRVARDGGLVGVRQSPGAGVTEGPFIPTDRLVVYVNDKEGADWHGNSVLRASYKHWLIKDALLRLGPMVVERNGMGVPVVTGPEAGRAKGLAIARAFRAGSESGAFLPEGYSVQLVGVTGTTRDELPLVEYHDRAASRSLLAMFLDLGMTGGLGDAGVSRTFVQQFRHSLTAITTNLEDTFSEHVLRDLVELNYGPDEPYPLLKFDPFEDEHVADSESLKALVEARLLTPDLELEQEVRRTRRLPARVVDEEAAPSSAPAGGDVASSPFSTVGLPALVAAGILGVEEARELLGLAPGAPIPDDAVVPFSALSEAAQGRLRTTLNRLGYVAPSPAAGTILERIDALRDRAAQLTAT